MDEYIAPLAQPSWSLGVSFVDPGQRAVARLQAGL